MHAVSIEQEGIGPGFADPTLDSLRVFRALLDAMARPGSISPVVPARGAPDCLDGAAAAICLCLADLDTPVWLDPELRGAVAWLRFHTGCRVTERPETAAFALVGDSRRLPALAAFAQGEPDYPERSTTIIVQVPTLVPGEGWVMSGPGVDGTARLAVAGFGPDFPTAWRANNERFPCGVDMVFAAGDCVAALPRTTRLEG